MKSEADNCVRFLEDQRAGMRALSNEMKKKIVKLLSIIALAVFLVAGCGKAGVNLTNQPAPGYQGTGQTGSADSKENKTAVPASLGAPDKPESKTVTDQDVFNYLLAQVPEIAAYRKEIADYNQENQADFKFIMRMDSYPDPQATDNLSRDYYGVYVGEDAGDHTNRWATFDVERDLTGIMVEDVLSGTQISLTAWRQQMKDEANGE